jgi:hypothetical protein
MYSKYRTLSDVINLLKTSIDLPRDAIIDQILLKVTMTVANAGATTWTSTNEALLRAIQEIRVVSDGSTVHYALSAADVVVLNAYNSKNGFAAKIDSEVSIEASEDITKVFYLRLDEGDILAASKDSLELKTFTNPTIATDVTITALTITTTIVENVLNTQEFVASYGANLEFAAEPKVYALSVSVPAGSELTNVLDLPTGSLLRAGVLQFCQNGLAGGVDPSAIGLINTSPDRREILNVDYPTLRALNAAEYDLGGGAPSGVVLLNYGKDVTSDGYGLRGWRFVKGDYQITAKTATPATLRYISLEHVVNAGVFDASDGAVLEQTR